MEMFYEAILRYFRTPWSIGAREEPVSPVESGHLKPCWAIGPGCDIAGSCIFLAQYGFDATGVGCAAAAVELERKRAQAAGVQSNFIVDDLTNLC